MIVAGIVVLILGFIFGVPALWTVGLVALIIGLVLAALGSLGHAVGGRRHYY
jgi:uncharacterized membrane protein